MKDLKTLLYGSEHAAKMEQTASRFDEIKNNYSGDFDVENNHMYTIDYGNGTRTPILSFDENVPKDLSEEMLKEFKTIWN